MSDIRPGLHVEFFYEADYERDNIHVRHSIIYDVMGEKLILAQSSPSLLHSSIGKHIVVTYLIKQPDGKPARLGFYAKIMDPNHAYELSSGETVPAIVIQQAGLPRSFNIRLSYRLRVPSSSNLKLMIKGKNATLIDVSLGGAMISGTNLKGIHPHEQVDILFGVQDQTFDLVAEVLRIWSPGGEGDPRNLQLAALKFVNAPRLFENVLGKAIFTIERQLLAEDTTKTPR